MKNTILIILVWPLLLFTACQSGGNQSEASVDNAPPVERTMSEKINTTTKVASTQQAVEEPEKLPPPKPSLQRVENDKKETEKSIFLSLGCCKEVISRLEDCCCVEVLEKYKELTGKKDPNLGNYKMKDPILGNCRRKMAKAFELVDFPPKAGVEGEFDDLF